MVLILELFKNTGSVGRVAKKKGFRVISVDMDEQYKPEIVSDILELDYEKLPTPDFIWASPPCNTFSNLVNIHQDPARDGKTGKALNSKGKEGDRILRRTIKIISYFQKKNKNLGFVIENPHAMMRLQPAMKKLDLATTTYCQYGDVRYKPTDFFNNFDLELKPVCSKETPHAKNPQHINIVDLPLNERYKIPSKLIKEIFKQAGLD